MLIEIYCNNGANNLQSTMKWRISVKEFGLSEKEWERLDEIDKQKLVEDFAYENGARIDFCELRTENR